MGEFGWGWVGVWVGEWVSLGWGGWGGCGWVGVGEFGVGWVGWVSLGGGWVGGVPPRLCCSAQQEHGHSSAQHDPRATRRAAGDAFPRCSSQR